MRGRQHHRPSTRHLQVLRRLQNSRGSVSASRRARQQQSEHAHDHGRTAEGLPCCDGLLGAGLCVAQSTPCAACCRAAVASMAHAAGNALHFATPWMQCLTACIHATVRRSVRATRLQSTVSWQWSAKMCRNTRHRTHQQQKHPTEAIFLSRLPMYHQQDNVENCVTILFSKERCRTCLFLDCRNKVVSHTDVDGLVSSAHCVYFCIQRIGHP